jgi:hypothetical protein
MHFTVRNIIITALCEREVQVLLHRGVVGGEERGEGRTEGGEVGRSRGGRRGFGVYD